MKVVISYDKLIKRDIELKGSSKSCIVSSFVNNRQPDILISLYKDNKFEKSMIVEAKYRKKRYIYNESNHTDVVYQAMSYRNFVYYDGEIKKISTKHIKPIEKVVVVYIAEKDEKECFKHDMYEDIEFISINPIEEEQDSSCYDVKNSISEFLGM